VEYPVDLLCWAAYVGGFFLSWAKYKAIGMPLSALALVTLLIFYFYYRSDFFAIKLKYTDLSWLAPLFFLIGFVLDEFNYNRVIVFILGFLSYQGACLGLRDRRMPLERRISNTELITKERNPAKYWAGIGFGVFYGTFFLMFLHLMF
jgi:hypothetical protein